MEGIKGLPGQTQFQLDKFFRVDKRRLREYVGRLTDEQMKKIDAALRESLYLDGEDYLPTEVEAP